MNRKRKIIIFIIICFVVGIPVYYKYDHTFTPEKWKSCVSDNFNSRRKWIDDFEKKYNVIGMEIDEVESLLGDATSFEVSYNVYDDFEELEVDEYWYYRYHDDLEGWRIYLLGIKDNKVVAKKRTIEAW